MLAAKFAAIFPHLDERQRRLLMGAEARAVGHGGIRLVARAAGVREATVSAGADELDSGGEPLGRARRPAEGASGRRTWTGGCARRCWPWSGRRSGATRCRRCGGRPSRPASWPRSTIPTQPGLYGDLASDPRVLRVVALSGGYSRDEACARLARDPTLIASFSRALLEGLTENQTGEQFNTQLDSSIGQIYQASVHKQPTSP